MLYTNVNSPVVIGLEGSSFRQTKKLLLLIGKYRQLSVKARQVQRGHVLVYIKK